MDLIASLLWKPVLSLVYIELGIIVLFLTGFIGWRKVIPALPQLWKNRATDSENSHARHISPWKAFFTSLAASVGVGNLAGVSTAIHLGGPGALFWIWVSALMGMSFRMSSVWLSMRYQGNDAEKSNYATPMAYMDRFIVGKWSWVPVALATLLMIKGFVTSNLIQANSVAHAIQNEFGSSNILIAAAMAGLVAVVILGGMQQIVSFSVAVTPWMIGMYLLAGIYILMSDIPHTLEVLQLVFTHAFTPYSVAGGVAGYTVMQALQFGTSRGIFSHASGIGVAPFLHASNEFDSKDSAFLAAFVPVVDTLIVCSVTGLVVLGIGDWGQYNGAYLTTSSFHSFYGDTGRVLIIACLIVFAFTTMINWAYYAERCFQYLGGQKIKLFRWLFIFVSFCGPFFPVKLIWSFADVIIGVVIVLHLFSLLYIIMQHRELIMKELGGVLTSDSKIERS